MISACHITVSLHPHQPTYHSSEGAQRGSALGGIVAPQQQAQKDCDDSRIGDAWKRIALRLRDAALQIKSTECWA